MLRISGTWVSLSNEHTCMCVPVREGFVRKLLVQRPRNRRAPGLFEEVDL